MGSTTKRVTT
ncbi:hypothetical protein M8C21_020047 [Ambrosia artemisiifolia]|uniref:Uncharacterized protein n=1 Tax=Ambrosia artemisiifolia TaxID=4212 RepID=A0AAD5CX00_AMBAR|nr:hypothetical protein M8C21_020047 [Ambrosia artemisiifolia]